MPSQRVLIPLPTYGFDPSEVAIPWKILAEAGLDVQFTTPSGAPAAPDQRMLHGHDLGIWKRLLRARPDAVAAFAELARSPAFARPLPYAEAREADFDGLLLPGGHDKGVKEYLESPALQQLVVDFFAARKPVGAICHGVVLAARSIAPGTGQSVIHGYQTTALLKSQERAAYQLTRLWLADYYLTYPEITVEDEVTAALANPASFQPGPLPMQRDTRHKPEAGFVVRDRNYLSARWPGDAYRFALEFRNMLADSPARR
ncbi:MAG: type 1 glutamine amidotransferase domain-containing protein [Bacteroidota bacterium]|nr:type 1 glutamine amidotransferase domain-containing protein [Bacteroidota bacterium]